MLQSILPNTEIAVLRLMNVKVSVKLVYRSGCSRK